MTKGTYDFAAYFRARKLRLKLAGLCQDCGKEDAEDEKTLCKGCLESRNKSNRKRRGGSLKRRPYFKAALPIVFSDPKPIEVHIYVVASLLRGSISPPERLDPEHEAWVKALWQQQAEARKPFKPVKIERILQQEALS